jgi:hypothetical protein
MPILGWAGAARPTSDYPIGFGAGLPVRSQLRESLILWICENPFGAHAGESRAWGSKAIFANDGRTCCELAIEKLLFPRLSTVLLRLLLVAVSLVPSVEWVCLFYV